MNALRLFAGRCARATRKKSLRPSKSAPASFSPHEEVERRRAQRAPGRWSYRPRRVASESGPFRSTASLVAKTGAGRRRLKLSLHFELMADACPLPLSSNWLQSNLEAARIGRRLLERRAQDARSFGALSSFPNDKERALSLCLAQVFSAGSMMGGASVRWHILSAYSGSRSLCFKPSCLDLYSRHQAA